MPSIQDGHGHSTGLSTFAGSTSPILLTARNHLFVASLSIVTTLRTLSALPSKTGLAQSQTEGVLPPLQVYINALNRFTSAISAFVGIAMHTVFSEYNVRQRCRLDQWGSNGLVGELLLPFTTHISRAVSVACPPPWSVSQPRPQGILSPISPSWLWGRRRLDDGKMTSTMTARAAIYRRVSILPPFPEKYATTRRASVPLDSRVFPLQMSYSAAHQQPKMQGDTRYSIPADDSNTHARTHVLHKKMENLIPIPADSRGGKEGQPVAHMDPINIPLKLLGQRSLSSCPESTDACL